MAWANQENGTYDYDMISGAADHRVLKVNDVNVNNDAKIAVHAINSSTNANARALKVEGTAEIGGIVISSMELMFGQRQLGEERELP